MGIQMSPKYGANNSYHICPWCGEKTGAYTSFGLLPNDEKAPETIFESYEPCKNCAEQWSRTVPVIEIRLKQLVPGTATAFTFYQPKAQKAEYLDREKP